jgi:hypothetical protein
MPFEIDKHELHRKRTTKQRRVFRPWLPWHESNESTNKNNMNTPVVPQVPRRQVKRDLIIVRIMVVVLTLSSRYSSRSLGKMRRSNSNHSKPDDKKVCPPPLLATKNDSFQYHHPGYHWEMIFVPT